MSVSEQRDKEMKREGYQRRNEGEQKEKRERIRI